MIELKFTPPPPPSQANPYLLVYNTVLAAGWAYVLYLTFATVAAGGWTKEVLQVRLLGLGGGGGGAETFPLPGDLASHSVRACVRRAEGKGNKQKTTPLFFSPSFSLRRWTSP